MQDPAEGSRWSGCRTRSAPVWEASSSESVRSDSVCVPRRWVVVYARRAVRVRRRIFGLRRTHYPETVAPIRGGVGDTECDDEQAGKSGAIRRTFHLSGSLGESHDLRGLLRMSLPGSCRTYLIPAINFAAVEPSARSSKQRAVARRCHSRFTSEQECEATRTAESEFIRELRNRIVGVAQQRLRALDAAADDVLKRR